MSGTDKLRAANAATWARRQRGEGFIYVAEVMGTDLLKVGFSLDPERRMYWLKADYQKTFRLLGAVPGSNSLERKLHSWLGKRLTPGNGREFYRASELRELLEGAAA